MDELLLGGSPSRDERPTATGHGPRHERSRRAVDARRRWSGVAVFVAMAVVAASTYAIAAESNEAAAAPSVTIEQLPARFNPYRMNQAGQVLGLDYRSNNNIYNFGVWDGADIVAWQGTTGSAHFFSESGDLVGGIANSSAPTLWSPSGSTTLEKPRVDGDEAGVYQMFGANSTGAVLGSTTWRHNVDQSNGVVWDSASSAPRLLSALSTVQAASPSGRLFGTIYGSTWRYSWADASDAPATQIAGFPTGYVSSVRIAGAVGDEYIAARPLSGPSFLWHAGTVTALTGLSDIWDVNGEGYVLGNIANGSGLALRDPDGELIVLKDLFPSDLGVQQVYGAVALNDACQMVVQANVKVEGEPPRYESRYYRLSLAGCQRSLEGSFTSRPDVQQPPRVGSEFEVAATFTNRGKQAVTDLQLLEDVGLRASDGIELVDGPTWSPVGSLAPGQSVEVRWTVVSDKVGYVGIEAVASGTYNHSDVEAVARTDIQITPPIDVKVDTGQTEAMVLGDQFPVSVTVTNEWDQAVEAIKPESLVGTMPSSIVVWDGPTGPDGAVPSGGYRLEPGQKVKFDYRVVLQEEAYPLEIKSHITGRDPDTNAIFFVYGTSGSPDELKVSLEGFEQVGDLFTVEVGVENTGDDPLDEVAFIDQGLAYNPDVYEEEERGEVTYVSGPEPALPEALQPGERVTTTFRLAAEKPGGVLLVGRVRGDLPNDTTLRAQDSIEVRVDTCERNFEEMRTCVVDLLSDQMGRMNAQLVKGSNRFEEALAALYPEGTSAPANQTQAAVGQYIPTMSEALKALIPTNAEEAYEIARQGIPAYYSHRLSAAANVLKGTVAGAYSIGNGYIQNFVWVTPEIRDENIGRVVDFALAEGGYQAEGIGQYLDVLSDAKDGEFDSAVEKLRELQLQNDRITGALILSAENYVDSKVTQFSNWKVLATQDRVAATVQLLETKGDIEGTVAGLVVEQWMGARFLRLLETPGLMVKPLSASDDVIDVAKAVDPPPKVKRPTGEPDAPESPGLGDPDAPTSPKSMDRPKRLEDLDVGDITVDAIDQLLNGHPAVVQEEFDRIIAEIKDETGLDIQIQARSAEKEGIQKVLDGQAIAKEQWNKAKSVNFIDTTFLGAPSAMTGQAAFYPPKPDWAKINSLADGDPLKGLVMARIQTQNDLWKKWSGETLDSNGVVVKSDPQQSSLRRDFEKMLSEDGYDFSNSLRGQPAREANGDLVKDAAGNLVYDSPVAVQSRKVKLDMREVDFGDGRTAFVPLDRASGKPYGADVDIFSVLDTSKNPPTPFTGSNKSKLEIILQQKLRKSKIPFGEHGWTHSGFDLTDDLSFVRIQELYRVRPPAEAAEAVRRNPEAFGLPSDAGEVDILKMQDKVSAGEYVISYSRGRRSIGFGALPNLRFR